jgi:hypothetical protein
MFHSLWMNTMNRCLLIFLACGIGALAQAQDQLSAPLPVNEQVVQTGVPGLRKFPAKALRGKLQVLQAPDILIDGQRERLSPGARIRDTQQRLVMSAALSGQELIVNFVRNGSGEVHEVWILTAAEREQKVQPNTPERNFVFGSEVDALKKDDGKTPFNQLPSFDQLGRQQREQQPRR